MTPFTDDDLKRLKDEVGNGWLMGIATGNPTVLLNANYWDMQALLARLEAAEKVVRGISHHYTPCAPMPCDDCELILNWRRAAGK